MPRRGAVLVLVLVLALAGCTRVLDTPHPQAEQSVAPIPAGQVHDLLSPHVQDQDGNLFVTVSPDRCSGVAREVDPPFIAGRHPAATDGGHWADEGRVYIEEMVAVYQRDFDPKAALADARNTINSCRDVTFTVTTMRGQHYTFTLLPQSNSGSPDIALWSYRGRDWACDSAFVAAHNAAIEISTCGAVGGYDVQSLAREALKRINTLANTTV
ncbi:pknH-like domain protein [Mycobacterium sp. 852013-50091_SCH5140682]|uniref:sensor domain-containing protein n=1 Tax=Mycobacterium sp. 852013-50091_SCH5140682 TaxID=1834109 RepID=UPI0007EAA3F3|nr:sensor domain-containing protein [Mycobacterium sp. 852013-50091_SCH5140682]OBB99351.1 pknH-like domain protein [Mycobacterium sp. 852013-50091_SCH5140682]